MLKRVLIPLLATVLVASGIYQIRQHPHLAELFSADFWTHWFSLGAVMRVVHAHHVDEEVVTYPALRDRMLHGMLDNLDRYARYLDRPDYSQFEEETSQEYVGIGIEIERVLQRITVVLPIEGGPAARAGLHPGDQIVAVGETDISDASVGDAVNLLRGEPGTTVAITLFRPSENRRWEAELERQPVELPSVRDLSVNSDGVGYIRIAQFGARTGDEFATALETLHSLHINSLVIDLRNNPGGLLTAAVAVTSQFVRSGSVVVSTQGRSPSEQRIYRSASAPHPRQVPTAILINRNSASASEIVAGALQDYRLALIVGERSTGKGSVQSVYGLSTGDGLRFTTARYRTPSGRIIDEVGVFPDIDAPVDGLVEGRLYLQRRHANYLTKSQFRREFGFDPIPDEPLTIAEELVTVLHRIRSRDLTSL